MKRNKRFVLYHLLRSTEGYYRISRGEVMEAEQLYPWGLSTPCSDLLSGNEVAEHLQCLMTRMGELADSRSILVLNMYINMNKSYFLYIFRFCYEFEYLQVFVTYMYSTWARATSSPLQKTTSKSFCRRTNILIKFPMFSILIASAVLIFRVQNWIILNDLTGFAGLNSSNISESPGNNRGCCEFRRYKFGNNCLLTKRVAILTDSLKLAGCYCVAHAR